MSKPLPILSHMPWNIKQQIVEAVDLRKRFALRRCSSEFKTLVDNIKVTYSSLEIYFEQENIRISVVLRDFKSTIHKLFNPNINGDWNRGIDKAMITLKAIIGNPNVRLREFRVVFRKCGGLVSYATYYLRNKLRCLEDFGGVMASLPHKIAAEKFTMISADNRSQDVHSVMSFLQPGTLKDIILKHSDSDYFASQHNIDLAEIAETEQWKQAKSVQLIRYTHSVPLLKFHNFLSADSGQSDLTEDELRYVLDNFLCEDGWVMRIFRLEYNIRPSRKLSAFRTFFSQFADPVAHENRRIDAQFRIQRGGFECIVFIGELSFLDSKLHVSFFNPSKCPNFEQVFIDSLRIEYSCLD